MKQRFDGDSGRRLLVDALSEHKIVGGNAALAEELTRVGELLQVDPDSRIIEQGADDNHVYLIVSGSFTVRVNNKPVATRGPGDHVGEMAAIQQTQTRSATVVAAEPSLVLKITEPQLVALSATYPGIYRQFAKELALRLKQRNHLMTSFRDTSHVFVISSTEALHIAQAVKACVEHKSVSVLVWNEGVFRASHYPLEVLEAVLDRSDYAIAIAQPDDLKVSRGVTSQSARDNVLFELAFFMGRLGRHRSLLLEPKQDPAKRPSDLEGITAIPYEYDPADLAASLDSACSQVRRIIEELGPNN
jgi:predicted nucleotide-binding protein